MDAAANSSGEKDQQQQQLSTSSEQQQLPTSSEQQQQHKRRKQQTAISRFPSNIDAHLSSRRSISQFQPQQHNSPNPSSNHPVGQMQQQQQQANRSSPSPGVQMAYQDAWRVCHPEHERPFSSLQDACQRFPSNIDAHLSSRRSIPQFQPQQHNSPNPSSNRPGQMQQQQAPNRSSPSPGVQMAYQDARRVCHPEHERPFSSLQDACQRLLPYHVLADYEAEEEDRLLHSDTTGQILSRSQQWEESMAAKVSEFTETFERQVCAFNNISRKLSSGEFRSEERLMLEHNLAQEQRQSLIELRAAMHSRQQAGRDAQGSPDGEEAGNGDSGTAEFGSNSK